MACSVFVFLLYLFVFVPRISDGSSIKRTVSYRPADIVLVLAMSEEVSNSEYERMIDEIRALPDSLRMGLDNGECQMAVVIADSIPRTEVKMTTKEYKIRDLAHARHGGRTPTRWALRVKVELELIISATIVYPDRDPPAQIVVLITDGKPMHQDLTDWNFPWREDFIETEAAARHLRHSRNVDFFLAYIGDPSVETLRHFKSITGDFGRIFDSNVFSELVDALKKSLELVEYECENNEDDSQEVKSEATGCNSTCPWPPGRDSNSTFDRMIEPLDLNSTIGDQPTERSVFFCGGAVSGVVVLLVLEMMAFFIWKQCRASMVKKTARSRTVGMYDPSVVAVEHQTYGGSGIRSSSEYAYIIDSDGGSHHEYVN